MTGAAPAMHDARGPAMARFQAFAAASAIRPTSDLSSMRQSVAALLARPDLLDGVELERVPGDYARTLLWSEGPISVWAIVWAAGARSSIHDHHCSCCFGVLRGTVRERRFAAVDDGQAALVGEAVRRPGFIAAMLPCGPNIHQVVNDGDEEAVSIHVYGFDPRLHASSVRRDYRLATPARPPAQNVPG